MSVRQLSTLWKAYRKLLRMGSVISVFRRQGWADHDQWMLLCWSPIGEFNVSVPDEVIEDGRLAMYLWKGFEKIDEPGQRWFV